MPNPDEVVPIQAAPLPQAVQEFLTQQQNIVEQVEELEDADEETPVREVSPEELAERMRQMGLNPETTVMLGQVEAAPPAFHVAPPPAETVWELADQARRAAQPVSPVFVDTQQPMQQTTQEAQTTDDMSSEYREFRVRQDERFPHPEPGEIVMTRAQLGRTRRPQIQTKRFKVISLGGEPPHPMWWAAFALGQVELKADSYDFSYEDVMSLSTTMRDTFFYVKYDDGLSAIPAEPAAPEKQPEPKTPARARRCNWVSVIGSTVASMISASPKNNTFRAKVMAVLKEPIPDEMDTAEKIKDWIEFEFPRNPEDSVRSGMKFHVDYTAVERGTVQYSRIINGTYRGVLTRERIVELVRANKDKDWDQLVVLFREEINRLAQVNGQETPAAPELTNFEGTRMSFEPVLMTSIRSPIREILRAELTRSEINDLGI